MEHTPATVNSTYNIILANVSNIDIEETESDMEPFAAPPAPELEITKSTMLPFKDHKIGRSCTYLALGMGKILIENLVSYFKQL